MKGKHHSEDLQNNKIPRNTSSNLFLNIIIFLLVVLIIFLGYSLIHKIDFNGKNDSDLVKENALSLTQVEVMNGCGVSGVADKFTSYLRQKGFDVVQIGNYISFDIEKSMVIDRTGNMKKALHVADVLGINHKNVIQQKNKDYFLDVSIVIGKDFNQLKPELEKKE